MNSLTFESSSRTDTKKRPLENAVFVPNKRQAISCQRAIDNWAKLSDIVLPLFKGCNSSTRCCPMRSSYWTEYTPVEVGQMSFHHYPNPNLKQKWEQSSDNLSYHDFLRNNWLAKSVNLKEENVIYFNPRELNGVKASFVGGKILRNEKQLKSTRYIFALTNDQQLFITHKFQTPFGRIQHSSLSSGSPVRCAGWLTFDKQGQLTEISNFTGHYHIKKENVDQQISFLESHGVDLSSVKIIFSPNGKPKDHAVYSLDQWKEIE